MLDELKDLLSDAVRLRFDHRFTAGAHVTGGLDSGVVAALARTHFLHQDRFYGFSWSPVDHFPDNIRYDERDLVRSSCGMADIQPVFSTVDAAEYSRFVSGFYHTQGYFYENKTLEQAGELGVNLLFSGWGGDEFISMGDSGIDSDLLFHFKWRTFFQRNRITHLKGLIKTLLYFIIYPAFGLLDPKVARSFKEYTHYLNKPFKRSDRKALRDFYFYRSRRQQHLGLLHFYHLQSRTEAWAINGFRHGIEYRYPLLDKRIIEYILKIPSELLVKSGHYRPLVREISNGILPEEVRWHWEKVDPVQYAHEQDLIKTSAIAFMNEVELWRSNPDLSFINFDLLEKDIRWFKEHSEGDYRALFRTVVTIKGLHEFCHVYYK
jgi:asparagine synthase (glutamine-hydrolysing)